MGKDVCDIYRPGSSELYRENEVDARNVKCLVASLKVGFYNASVHVPDFGGWSWNHSKSLQPGPTGQLYMYELHPDVTSVYPRVGSPEGGTLLRVKGSGFGNRVDMISVDIDGVPCEVQAVTNDLVTCITGETPLHSAAIQGINGSFPLEAGIFFEGARGSTMKIWTNIDGVVVSSIMSADGYPDLPDVFYNIEDFASPYEYGDRYGVVLEAFFTAYHDSWHTFYFASDDNGELWFANTTNSSEARLIASVPTYTSVNQYTKHYANQISDPIYLRKGQKCYLKALAKEHDGGDFVKAAVLVHNPGFNYTSVQTLSAKPEFQQVFTRATVYNEVQSVTVNYSASISHMKAAFHLRWSGQQSSPLDVQATNEDVRQAVLGLFEGNCNEASSSLVDLYDIDTFEEEETERWNPLRGKTQPNIVYSDAYCGRKSLEIVSGDGLNFNGTIGLEDLQDESGYSTTNYPYVCMAYRIPAGSLAALAVNIRDHGWYSVPLTDAQYSLPYTVLTNWADSSGEQVRDDNKWHYSCFDLDTAVKNALGFGQRYKILGIGFASPVPLYRNGPFYIDEFSISSETRNLQQTNPPARPNGLVLLDVVVSNMTFNDGDSNSITFLLEYEATTCFDSYSLIEAIASNQAKSQGLHISSNVVRNASSPIQGTFRLSIFNQWTPEIPYDANWEEVKLALETIPEVGEVFVAQWLLDATTPCKGRGWNIRFNSIPNDLPLMMINSSLQGENIDVQTKEFTNGGILFDPIPGYMLSTVERTPQVQVTVNGVRASCQGSGQPFHATRYSHNTSCQFAYSHGAQPVVTSLSPESGFSGDVITIVGSGFESNIEEYVVHFGTIPCKVRNANRTVVQCVAGDGYAGTHQLYFQIFSSGKANTTGLLFQYKLNFSLTEPLAGSIGGGLIATLNGKGFLYPKQSNQSMQSVLFHDEPCTIISSNFSELQCIVPAGNTNGTVNVTVVIVLDNGEAISYTSIDAFTYSDLLTPSIESVNPNRGSVVGDTVITITGSGFSTIVSENSVRIGSVECIILSATNESITCVTGQNVPGTYHVVVVVAGNGIPVIPLNFSYELEVDGFSHFAGSVFGGQRILVTGAGFGTNSSVVSVLLGDNPCDIEYVTNNLIQCVTKTSSITHYVYNLGYNSMCGLEYQWCPQNITIQEGDTVEWKWSGGPEALPQSVAEVEDENATEYNGFGFHSKMSIDGQFRHTFDVLGVYYYVSIGHGQTGVRGSVTVTAFKSKLVPITVSVSGIVATHTSNFVNASLASMLNSSESDIEFPTDVGAMAHYMYSSHMTPVIVELVPAIVGLGDQVTVRGMAFANKTGGNVLNTLTIGGKACLLSDNARMYDTPSSNITNLDANIGFKDEINCTVPKQPPGLYRVVIHVAGRGWGFGSLHGSTIEYQPTFSIDVISGSVCGGTEVTLSGVGFHPKASIGNSVRIGNTVCDVQSLTDSDEWGNGGRIVCVTRPSLSDGYAAVVIENSPLGYWQLNGQDMHRVNDLVLPRPLPPQSFGPSSGGDHSVYGNIETGVDGISGNNWTNTAIRFNASWISVQYVPELKGSSNVSGEFWLKWESNTKSYQFVLGAYRSLFVAHGYALWMNPCGELEYWLAVNATSWHANSSSCVISDDSNVSKANIVTNVSSCGECNGIRTVSLNESIVSGLPAGVWSVIIGPQLRRNSWSHVVFSWLNESDETPNVGVQALYVDGVFIANRTTNFSSTFGQPLLIGGQTISKNGMVQPFVGVVDEVALYGQVLDENTILKHYHYGSTNEQLVSLYYEMEDHRGEGTVPNVIYPARPVEFVDVTVNWTAIYNHTIHINASERLQFVWNEFHSVVQVGVHEFNSCTHTANENRTVWGLAKSDGAATVVGLESGQKHYFISDVNRDCDEGHKLMVFVGSEYVIDWGLGQEYSPISIPYGTGLRFQWLAGPGIFHDVVELASREALEKCSVGQVAEASGSVVGRYSNPLTTGSVSLTGLDIGTHYFASAVSGHCAAGMHIVVTVTGDDSVDVKNSHNQQHQTVHINWRLKTYLDIVIVQGDTIVFEWEDFHSLSQVSKHAYDECDILSKPLKEWSQASIPGRVTISGLSPGTYYFMSTVSGECTAGMKVAVIVNPRSNVHTFGTWKQANCRSSCSYIAKEAQTPVILSIEPDHGAPGTAITIVGIRLLPQDFGNNSLLTSVLEVRVGDALCRDTVQVLYNNDNQTISCVTPDQKAGDKNIRVLAYGSGFNCLGVNVFATFHERLFFHVDTVVTEVIPTNGSIAGGTEITLVGHGFSNVKSHSTVQIGGYYCDVTESSVNKIKCVTSSVESMPDLHDIPLPIFVFMGNSLINSSAFYTYSTNSTPVITNVTRSVVVFGDTISISGIFYSSQPEKVEVGISRKSLQVGFSPGQLMATRQECKVESISDSEITCIVGPRVAGDRYVVTVKVENIGYAIVRPEGAADIVYLLEVENVSPTSFGLGGGVEVTLTGSAFLSGTLGNDKAEFHFKPELSSVDIQKKAASAGQALVAMNLHGKLVSSHGIDYGVTYTVTVCGQVCYIQLATYNTTVCVVPPSQLLSDVGSAADKLSAIQSCAVETFVNGSSGTSHAQLHYNITYKGSFTPYIDSVSPRQGGTAGGTILTITGSGFNSSINGSEVTVMINGVECSLREANDSVIKCRTGAQETTVKGLVFVVVPGKGSAIELDPGNATSPSSAQFEYVDRWSSRFTWGGNDPPGDGASVYIQAGQTVLLDTSPSGILSLLVLDGTLIFDDNQDVHLQSKYIFINGGRLQIGTEENPFMHKAIITLHGNIRDPEIPVYGAKVLALRRGSLEMHGRPRNITWTRLAKTAMKNDSVLELMEPVDWLKDDVIVIASTSKDGNETETANISSVEDGGYKIVLHSALNFTHYGITDVMEDGQFIDIRAEVGLLSHNVIVQGSRYVGDSIDDLGADQFGSHIMIFRPKAEPDPIRLEHVEVRYGGQAFRLGRYAVHFHLSDQMNGSYVRHCSIHHSNNRAITAHAVHEMLFEGVVAYDIKGHTFFIEDGIETGNRYIGNLGLLTRGSSSLLNTDQIPATFWITNPNNTFIGNAAAGSRAYGFWYDLDPHPSGPSFTRTVCPNQVPFGEFRDNVAHTNAEFGFRIWETYIPKDSGCSGGDVAANFYNLVTYSNGINGVEMSVIGHVRLIGFKIADNRDDGIAIQESYGSWGGPMIKDTLIISHSIANQGSPQKSGIRTPSKRVLTISNVTFARFDDPSLTCLRACSHCKLRQGGFQYQFEKITYLGNSSLHRTAFQWEHEVLYKDLDGTLAGVPGGWVTPANGLLPPEYCQQRPEYSMNAAVPGSVCTSDVQLLRFAWNKAEPSATLTGRDVLISIGNLNASTLVPWRKKRLTHSSGYMVTLPSHRVLNLSYVLPPNLDVDNTAFSAELFDVPINESVIIQSYYHTAPDHFRVGSNREDIGRDLSFSDNHTSWHFNNETLQFQYILSAKGQTSNLSDLSYTFSKEPCPVGGCPVPVIGSNGLESRWRRWSVPSDWPNNQVPLPGSNVTINSTWKMYVDVAEVNVEKLEIQGVLQFEDTQDIVFNATWIIIIGNNSRFIVGQEGSPFQHEATIYLKGSRQMPNLALSRNVIVGSKAIGVFGELHLIGKRHNVMWTRLSQSAVAGNTILHLESSSVDWKARDEIVLAPSGYLPSEAEVLTIRSVTGNVISLEQQLQYNHSVDKFLTGHEVGTGNYASRWWHGNGRIRVAAEVGILSQNVRIIGEEDIYNSISVDEFGCRVFVGYYERGDFEYTGKAFIDGVQFKHCGQGGFFSSRDPRYVVAFKNGLDGMAGSYVKHSSVHTGFNTAFGTLASNYIEFSNNVVYRSVDSMFKISSLNCNVTNNLGVLTRSIQVARPSDKFAVDFPATYLIRGMGNTIKNNVAAGSERVGFYFPGESCVNGAAPNSTDAKFWGNAAHTGMIGLVITGLNEPCSAAGGIVIARQWEYGVFSSTASSVAVGELAVAVGHTGLCLNIFGPDPVKHLFNRKWIKVDDSLVVGETENEPCFTSTPAYCPKLVCSRVMAPKLGIMMATFAKERSQMDGSRPWHLPITYPAIAGQVNITSVTFARFKDYGPCNHTSYVIANNKLSPDAMHPNYFEKTGLIDIESDRIAHLYPPNPAWIVQEDCIDMDCDGPKHSVVHDVDGKLVQTSGKRGSIIPEAEIRFDPSRLPETMLYKQDDPTTRLDPNTLIDKRGIARGEDGSFDGSNSGCLWVTGWNAYKCSGLNHQMLIIESMDADSEVRRVSPIVLHGGDTGFGTYTDIMNGPMDHGWCTHYTCLKRLSTFFSIVVLGTDYQLWFTATNPGHLRFLLLNTHGGEGVRLSIWYKNPQRKDIYKSGVYVEASNAISQPNGRVRRPNGDQYIPKLDNSDSGANYFDRMKQTLHLVIKGSEPVEIKTPPVVQVALDLAVSLDDFFDPDSFVQNVAFVLGIDESSIRVVDVIAEDTPISKRRRRGLLAEATSSIQMVIEIGDLPAANISQQQPPSIEEQNNEGGGVETDSADSDAELTNTTTISPTISSAFTAVGEQVPSVEELLAESEASMQKFVDDTEIYLSLVKQTNHVNNILNTFINEIQTGELQFENVTITGMTAAPALPPPKPVKPVPPPGLDNLTTSDGNPVYSSIDVPTTASLVIDVENNDTEIVFQIPAEAVVSREPPVVSGHLVYVSVAVVDANGDPVEKLGLSKPWKCTASLIYDDKEKSNQIPLLEGIMNVSFHNGIAEFTRLRVDRAADSLQLLFIVSPSRFTVRTSTFSIVSPDISSTDHITVYFSLDGNYEDVVTAGPGGKDGFLKQLKEYLAKILDVDKSRLIDLMVSPGSILCSVTIFDRAETDPVDVPTLVSTVDYLKHLVESGQLIMTHGSYKLPSDKSSFHTDKNDRKDSESFPVWAIILTSAVSGLIVVILVVLCMRIHSSGSGKKSQKKVHPDHEWTDTHQPLQASKGNDIPMTEFKHHAKFSFGENNGVKETQWAGPVGYAPPPHYDRTLTPVESTSATGLLS